MTNFTSREKSLLLELSNTDVISKIFQTALERIIARVVLGDLVLEDGKAQMAVHAEAERAIQGIINSMVE